MAEGEEEGNNKYLHTTVINKIDVHIASYRTHHIQCQQHSHNGCNAMTATATATATETSMVKRWSVVFVRLSRMLHNCRSFACCNRLCYIHCQLWQLDVIIIMHSNNQIGH